MAVKYHKHILQWSFHSTSSGNISLPLAKPVWRGWGGGAWRLYTGERWAGKGVEHLLRSVHLVGQPEGWAPRVQLGHLAQEQRHGGENSWGSSMPPENIWHQRLTHDGWGELGTKGTGWVPHQAAPTLEHILLCPVILIFPNFQKSLLLGRLPLLP